jgi:beta-xylosidase
MTSLADNSPQARAVTPELWRDPRAAASERAADIVSRMTLREKLAQLISVWVGVAPGTAEVAPLQHELLQDVPDLDEVSRSGLGQLTRTFGTSPVVAAEGARALARFQRELVARSRFGIPAIAHEECLVGLMAAGATTFPGPLVWGGTFSPGLVAEMGQAIAASMRQLGVHQGLAPVLDVARDMRWGRVEECIAEDPYLVGSIGAAYVTGLESGGVVATLKHFVGYAASRSGRNLSPVSVGPRELADTLLVPFEMALRAGARSVMHSYTELDGLPCAADRSLLTTVLRDRLGFTGTVVADYFGITFLHTQHHVAEHLEAAAALALTAGVDVELPNASAYWEPLHASVLAGRVAKEHVDVAVGRVLRQKIELGLLEAVFDETAVPATIDLDPPAHRRLARRIAEAGIVLLATRTGQPPLTAGLRRVAVVGPNADDPRALMGGYSFTNHVETLFPGSQPSLELATVLDAVRAEVGAGVSVVHSEGVNVDGGVDSGIAAAVAAARAAELCLAVVGDRAGLFGRGTVGEGCDVTSLTLPGRQQDLLDALLDTGTPVVVVVLSGRPYRLGRAATEAQAVLAAWFPGEEGASAVAGVLSGRVNPAGRTTVSWPGPAGGAPWSYREPPLGMTSAVSNVDTRPQWAFGHGLSWTSFGYTDLAVTPQVCDTAGQVRVRCTVTNTGATAGDEVVQLYASDLAAQVTRPNRELLGFHRLSLQPGDSARVEFDVHTDRLSFTGRELRRIVEPGEVRLAIGPASDVLPLATTISLVGPTRSAGADRQLDTPSRHAVRHPRPSADRTS